MSGRVFGIGLSRTGTRSLNAALNLIGVRSVHLPLDRLTYDQLRSGAGRLSLLDHVDGLTDIITVPFYRRFDAAYPGSKFILTIRGKDAWMASMRRMNARWLVEESQRPWRRAVSRVQFDGARDPNLVSRLVNAPQRVRATRYYRRLTYGACALADGEGFSALYDRHHQAVEAYFRDRPADCLILRICDGEGWTRLCRFLDRPVPAEAFPHRS
jgi:hypothetical protein